MVRLFKVALGAVLISLVGSIHAHAAAINGTPPHSLCTTPIGQYEARIWTGPDRTGICRPLEFVPAGSNTVAVDSFGDPWVSWDAPYGFPNDAVSSAETGSGVYL